MRYKNSNVCQRISLELTGLKEDKRNKKHIYTHRTINSNNKIELRAKVVDETNNDDVDGTKWWLHSYIAIAYEVI